MPTVHGLPLPPSGVTIDGSEVLWVDKEIGGDWFTYQFTIAEVLASVGGGTVSSVGLSLPAMFTVSGSPVTAAGTLTAVLANQSANRALIGPASGSPAAPTFRALVGLDLPLISSLSGTSGVAGSDLMLVEQGGVLLQATVSQILAGAGAGSVTSVGLSLPAMFTVSGSPVTAAGTLTAVLATQAANRIFAGPASGAAAAPTFRAAVGLDLPLISSLSGVSGIATSDLLMAEVGGVLVQATVAQVLADAAAVQEQIPFACSDETTALTASTGTPKVTFYVTRAMTSIAIAAGLTTAQASGSIFTINIKLNGTTIFSTKPTIDNTENTTGTASTPYVLTTNPTNLAIGDKLEFFIDQIGDGTAKGLKVSIQGIVAGAASGLQAVASQPGEMFSGVMGVVANGDITFCVKAAHAGTITETTTVCDSGTATMTFKIGTTPLGGTANSVSSSIQSQAQASANAFNAGDLLRFTISANAVCLGLSWVVKYTRVLAS